MSLRNATYGFVDDGNNYCVTRSNENVIKVKISSFYGRAIPVIIAIIFQIIFLMHTLYNIKHLQKLPNFQTIPFILIQIIGLFLNIIHFFKWYAIPTLMTESYFNNPSLCSFDAYSVLLIPFILHMLTLSILIVRLERIFQHTPSEWKKHTKWISITLINSIVTIILILWIIYLPSACIAVWKPYDYQHQQYDFLFYCNSYLTRNKITKYSGYFGIAVVVILNALFGGYVTLKLKKIHSVHKLTSPSLKNNYSTSASKNRGNNNREITVNNDRVYIIMKKNTILTISICMTTLFSYTMEFWGNGVGYNDWEFLLNFDYFLNPLFIGLMFKYNETLYYWIFCCCNRNELRQRYSLQNIEMMTRNISEERKKGVTPTADKIVSA